MERRRLDRSAGALLLAFGAVGLLPAAAFAAGCPMPIAISHGSSSSSGGAFIISELAGRDVGPELRFWQFGHYAEYNDGTEGQWTPSIPWLLGGVKSPGSLPDHFFVYQASWMGRGIIGCIMDFDGPQRRTVVEISKEFAENSPNHYTGYLIASVGWGPAHFDFDTVIDGNGGSPGYVRMVPVPTPKLVGQAAPSRDPEYMEVTLAIPDAHSYGDAGAPNLIAGYELFYQNDTVPKSSDAGRYRPVLSAPSESSPFGRVGYGAGQVRVVVRKPKTATYFVSRIIYADAYPLYSAGTSGNSEPVAPPGGSGEPSPTPSASPTPAPTPMPEPKREADVADVQDEADAGSSGPRPRPSSAATAAAAAGPAVAAPAAALGTAPVVVGGGVTVTGGGSAPGLDPAKKPGATPVANVTGSGMARGTETVTSGGAAAAGLRLVTGLPANAPTPVAGLPPAIVNAASGEPVAGGVTAAGAMTGGGDATGAASETSSATEGSAAVAATQRGNRARRAASDAAARAAEGGRSTNAPIPATAIDAVSVKKGTAAGGLGSALPQVDWSLWRLLDLAFLLSLSGLSYVVWLGRRG